VPTYREGSMMQFENYKRV